jgi:glycine cleavage system H protein
MDPDLLELAVDKFLFRFPVDRYYSADGIWVKFEGGRVRLGLSDFIQQRNGDVAFAEMREAGTAVRAGEEMGVVETIKVNLSLPSPLGGTVVEVNRDLETSPELVNLDPYGRGWLAVLAPQAWEEDRRRLRTAEEYLTLARELAEEEVRR